MADDPIIPTPPPSPAPLARKPPAGVSRSLAKLEQDLGGRAALVAALSHAPKSRDLDYVLGLIGDPGLARLSLAEICAAGGITAGELIEGYKAGMLARAHALSSKLIAEQLPDVVADTLRLSKPHEGTCHVCQGITTITPEPSKAVPNPEPVLCPVCGATGILIYPGDLDHKKLALELGKLTSKGGGVSVQVDARSAHLHSSGEAAGGSLEQLQLATDRILYGGGATALAILGDRGELAIPSAVDGELVDGDTPEEPSADVQA